jgi:hypothetical protein
MLASRILVEAAPEMKDGTRRKREGFSVCGATAGDILAGCLGVTSEPPDTDDDDIAGPTIISSGRWLGQTRGLWVWVACE